LRRGLLQPESDAALTAMPPPSAAEKAAVTGWIESLLGRPVSGAGDPGRVTARRLNRTEYNNTIRDLLGVTIRAAGEFPIDDSGYGFDNVGDVLSLSPLLMEKLMLGRMGVHAEALGDNTAEPGYLSDL
jgi:hypothetical protein